VSDLILPNSNRRQFLKSGSLIAGGTLAALSTGMRTVHAAEKNEFKVALIGCGGRGRGAAANILNSSHPVRIWAMADMFAESLNNCHELLHKEFDKRIDVTDRKFVGFDAYQKAIDSGVDLVILATPPGFRPQHFEAAVNAGKHVFMEKPVATDPEGVRRVLESAKLSREKKLGVGVGLQRRHHAGYLDTIKRLQDGEIGDIVSARAYWNDDGVWVKPRADLEKRKGAPLTEMEYQLHNWYYFNWLCGDHICEQHIHNLDVINWVKNAHPVKAHGMGGAQVRKGRDFGEIFDHHCVEFTYEDGTKMFSQCRHQKNCWKSVSESVQGTKGRSDINRQTILANGKSPWSHKRRGDQDPYEQEHQDLLDSIVSGNPLNEAEYGATSTMTSILGRMCTYSGEELTWDKALNSKVGIMPSELSFEGVPQSQPGPDGIYNLPIPGVTKVV
jgi:myo-inositol 2-dehydrogenase / D-chiro-inositol 1-dehydrogenase